MMVRLLMGSVDLSVEEPPASVVAQRGERNHWAAVAGGSVAR
jgi:hypothetical protein